MRTLLALALLAGGLFALQAPADSADAGKKRSVKARTTTAPAQPRSYSREEVECERAQYQDPAGYFAGYPCWAREALGQNGGPDRQ
jgi:hypothetical protein